MPTNRFAENYPCYANITIGPGNGTNAVQSSPAVSVPHRWDAGYASSSAPIAHDLRLDAYVGAVSYYLGTVSIRKFWVGFKPLFAVKVHEGIYDEALQGMPSGDLRAIKRASLIADVNGVFAVAHTGAHHD